MRGSAPAEDTWNGSAGASPSPMLATARRYHRPTLAPYLYVSMLPLALALVTAGARAEPAPANLLPNPSFELVEPPPPTTEQAKSGKPAPAEAWVPRTWQVFSQWDAGWSCPDDPAKAHSGRRCVALRAANGVATLRYGPMPVPDARPWTISFWARGKGQIVAGGYRVLPARWDRLPKEWAFTLGEKWQRFELEWQPGSDCRQRILELATRGPAEAQIDDVGVTYAGLPALGLPPERPLTKDEHTLLYLPFEEPLDEDAYFIRGVKLSAPDGGRFGRTLTFGPNGYVACSANENLDPAQGTIELWCRFLFPGNDGVCHPFVSIPGPEGMTLCKDQYSHVSFGFSSGWASLAHASAQGYAWAWQPGVWRHIAACWDKDLMQVFVDGKLIAWKDHPKLSRALGPELALGGPGMEIDDLRISRVVRYRVPVPPAE